MSYGGDPENDPIDAVRTIISDDDSAVELLTDAQIEFYLSQSGGNVWLASKSASLKLAAYFGRKARRQQNELEDDPDRNAAFWLKFAEKCDDIAMSGAVSFFWGGLGISSKTAFNQNSDNERAAFTRRSFIKDEAFQSTIGAQTTDPEES